MPPASESPTPGPSSSDSRNRVADALYAWCSDNHEVGHVFNQSELLDSGIVPAKNVPTLLQAIQTLSARKLFKTHEFRGQSGQPGWELVSRDRAANYAGLTREEHLVFSIVDSAGNSGIWTKAIQSRVSAHPKVLDRTYKSLESKGRIKQVKNVKHPTRKTYIVAGLQPNEEVTGGSWFNGDELDVELMNGVAWVIEQYVCEESWIEVEVQDLGSGPKNNKRKMPDDGFDLKGKGKAKMPRTAASQHPSQSPDIVNELDKQDPPQLVPTYVPRVPGYRGYPSLADITRQIMAKNVVKKSALPQNAIDQLLQVMVYDDRIAQIHRLPHDDEEPDDPVAGTITAYRCYRSPGELRTRIYNHEVAPKSEHSRERRAARRAIELEEIGRGGTSEVPCIVCPAMDVCGDGGPVNVATCPYFSEWYVQIAKGDEQAGDPWPGGEKFIKDGETAKRRRAKNLYADAPAVKVEDKAMNLT